MNMCTRTGDLDLIKSLIRDGISTTILYPDSKFSVESVMRVWYSRLGVFLDLNCADWYSEFILTEVSLTNDHSHDACESISTCNIIDRIQSLEITANRTSGYSGEKVLTKVCE